MATKFSRVHDTEADRIRLELAARARYNPRTGVVRWKKMINTSQGGGRLSSSSRIKEIESLLPAVMPLYGAAKK